MATFPWARSAAPAAEGRIPSIGHAGGQAHGLRMRHQPLPGGNVRARKWLKRASCPGVVSNNSETTRQTTPRKTRCKKRVYAGRHSCFELYGVACEGRGIRTRRTPIGRLGRALDYRQRSSLCLHRADDGEVCSLPPAQRPTHQRPRVHSGTSLRGVGRGPNPQW